VKLRVFGAVHVVRVFGVFVLGVLLLPGSFSERYAQSAPAPKRPLSHRDYDAWRDIGQPTLSRDGRLLAYTFMPQDGDGEVVVRNLATRKEWRVGVGDIPAPSNDGGDEQGGGDDPPPARGIRLAITSDGAYVVATTFPTKAEAERARKERTQKDKDRQKNEEGGEASSKSKESDPSATKATAGKAEAKGETAKAGATPTAGTAPNAPDKKPTAGKANKASMQAGGAGNGADADKKASEAPKAGLVIIDTKSGATTRIPAVKSIQVPGKGGAWLAYLKEAAARDREDNQADGRGRNVEAGEASSGQRRGGRGRGGRRDPLGSELVVRDLVSAREQSFANVLDYSFARDGKTLLYTVSSSKKPENGVYAVTPGAGKPAQPLLVGKGRYSRLTWDRGQGLAAFISDRDDADAKQPRYKAYLWQRGSGSAAEAVSRATAGFPADLSVNTGTALSFSRDGKRLFVAAAPPPKPEKDEDADTAGEDAPKVRADLWHWKDDVVQPMQRVRAGQERNRTYRGVYHIASKKYVQLADLGLRTVTSSDDGLRALGFDDQAYRRLVDYDGNYNDVYVMDASSGARKLAVKQLRGGAGGLQWSPDGKHAFYYQNKHWHLLSGDPQAPTSRLLTDKVPVAFSNERHDTPGPAASYGSAGWLKDSKSFLVYDRYDVWQLHADGRPPRNVTEGAGRKAGIELRVERIEAREIDDEEERGIDPDKPLTLRATDERTRATGWYRDSLAGDAPPVRLIWGDKRFAYVGRAVDADVLLISASRFDLYPDLFVTDSTFRKATRVTSAGAQLNAFRWGKSELISYKNADGVPLQAALYKPDNFDPKKKYPLLLNIYERMSQSVHSFRAPRPGTSVNLSYYVSNGYLVLTPDIIYTIGHPGPSALKCVLPAIQAVVDRGYVDEKAIGIQGHSWGGYQIAYMVTQTNRFRAAAAGAPVGNMTSAYSGIRWGTGQPRQWQYEQAQSRMARLMYEAPLEYLENSPVFHIQNVQTPMLILHNDGDTAVPWYQGIELYMGLRRTGKEAYLWNYNGEAHGLTRRHNQKDYSLRMQQFFDHLLKGAPKPEWMEKGIPFLDREDEKERFHQESAPGRTPVSSVQ
jgi:dipeptidyl aminopeptidase/acylaminoacyl peptidase